MTPFRLLCLPGDGIGPEVIDAALSVLDVVAPALGRPIEISHDLAGGICYETHGAFLRDETMQAARQSDAILFGAEGGPGWDNLNIPGGPTARSGLSRLRKELDLFANIRPARSWPALYDQTPFRREVIEGVDLVVLRELTSGIYFGEPRGFHEEEGQQVAVDTQRYTTSEVDRMAQAAFTLAASRKGKVTSADKANVMETGVLWRDRMTVFHKAEHPDIELEHLYADACLFELVRNPQRFDVIVADNLFGDLISDCAAAIAGSLGMLPSAALGPKSSSGKRAALYEPVHGSAPDIAGQNIANPIAAILSIAMMLDLSLGRPDVARRMEDAVEKALDTGVATRDIGGKSSTQQMAEAICNHLRNA